ncbi:ATP-binding protein [Longispora albida]|uniref:ATP-binding protein n=1 Tax=Longispora albida TaxID=203523 RepID=UPI0003787B87|nr:XRE family transcriptional regulator [Longispora albida]
MKLAPESVNTVRELADQFRLLRAREGKSQAQLAKDSGVPQSTIADMFKLDRKRVPDRLQFTAALNALTTDPALRSAFLEAHLRAGADPDPGPVPVPRIVPRELPPDVRAFTGRAGQLAELDRALLGGGHLSALITGQGGAGKTGLAVHWAHRVAGRFPDGQLYADLRGYDPAADPVTPGEVLGGFLRALGEKDSDIPHDPAARSARFRTLTAGRQILILIDNARSVDQVQQLLPGSPSCRAVVTSREAQIGMVALFDSYWIGLGPLPEDDALRLLGTIAGRDRLAAEPEAARDLADRCARLPLTLRVAAQVVASRPGESVAAITSQLDLLGAADPRAAAGAVFSWSYRQLPSGPARLFPLLGLHPGRHIDLGALAALYDGEAESEVIALLRAHLVEEHGSTAIRMHDLLRAYAAELAATLPDAERAAALDRLLDYYVHTTQIAKDTAHSWDKPSGPRGLPGSARHARTFESESEAERWQDTEHPNLVAAASFAAASGWPRHASWLSTLLWRLFYMRGHHADALVVHTAGRDAARSSGDQAAESAAEFRIGDVYWRIGKLDQALVHFLASAGLKRAIGDDLGVAHALSGIGTIHHLRGEYAKAIACYEEGLAIAVGLGEWQTEAIALSNLGEAYELLGQFGQAEEYYRRCLVVKERHGDREALASTLSNIAWLKLRRGQVEESAAQQREALELARSLKMRGATALALGRLGAAEAHLGRPAAGAEMLRRALRLIVECEDRVAEPELHNSLGTALHLSGERQAAVEAHQRALGIATEIGNRHEQARAHSGLAISLDDPLASAWHGEQAAAIYAALGLQLS